MRNRELSAGVTCGSILLFTPQGTSQMPKTFLTNAIHFIGSQAVVMFFGTAVLYLCHIWFGLTAEAAANNMVAAQMACAGFMARGWFC